MIKKNRILLLFLVAVLLVSLCLGLASCFGKKEPAADGPTAPVVGTEKRTYTVELKTGGGKALEDVGVYFYTDSTMAELVWFAKTDAEGKVSFTDLESTGYVAVLDKVPDGYKVEPYYPLTGETTEIVLETAMTDGDLANLSYKLGDVMMNFSVTDADGNEWVLSDLLAEKEAVVLNFWYVQCAPCKAEFPYLQEAYEKYEDKIALIAMNPINADNAEIKAFAEDLGLTFPMASCDPNWEKAMQLTAYPTTVVIDRFGTIALIHKGSIDESKVFEDAFEFFTADGYEQTTVEDIMDLEIKEAGSDSSNPIEIGGKTAFDVTVEPGQTVYYHLYKVMDLTLTVSNTNISAEYNDVTYPSGSGLSFTVRCPDTYSPAAVTFHNDSGETQTFTVRLTAKPGSFENPYELKLNKEFTTKISAGNDKGVNYMYTAKKSGILTVKCVSVSPDVKFDYTLTNEKTMQQNTLSENADAEEKTVSVKVKKGQKVRLTIGSTDTAGGYPGATYKTIATLGEDTSVEEAVVEKIKYAVTITDQNMIPIRNVSMDITKASGESDGSASGTNKIPKQKTGEAGAVGLELEKAVYDVVLTVPPGYECDTTQFQLNQDRPYVSIMLRQSITEMKQYTVTVTDAAGKPLSGVAVSIGTGFEITDASGKVVLELPVYNYTVEVTAPKGYIAEPEYAFAEGSTSLIVKLENGASEDGPTGEVRNYTVKVVDYNGNPKPGIMVQIKKNGASVDSQLTDSSGTVTTMLGKADYTVVLAFSGTKMYYEEKLAVLPAGTTELTIKVAPSLDESGYDSWGAHSFYYIGLGGTYVKMQSNIDNYYVFVPEEPGIYRFTTSDPNAILSYQNSYYYIFNRTEETDYDPKTNSFTMNWKQSQLGGNIAIGVTGAEDCIIEITRIGDPILDETDLIPEVYKAKKAPSKYTFKGTAGKLKYVDLKAKSVKIVLGSDGYYHLNSATGPLLYLQLGTASVEAPYITMYKMLGASGVGGTSFAKVFYENGDAVRKEDYTDCMLSFVNCADTKTGVYPLTEDLVYMMQNGGEYKGWWDPKNANCLFLDEDNNLDKSINLDIAWMFAVCYVP